jgi:hypothetical protein
MHVNRSLFSSFINIHLQVKRLHVQLNDKIISPRAGFLLRRAPGHCYFDFAQEIVFAEYTGNKRNEKEKKFETSAMSRIGTSNRSNDNPDVFMPNGCK